MSVIYKVTTHSQYSDYCLYKHRGLSLIGVMGSLKVVGKIFVKTENGQILSTGAVSSTQISHRATKSMASRMIISQSCDGLQLAVCFCWGHIKTTQALLEV